MTASVSSLLMRTTCALGQLTKHFKKGTLGLYSRFASKSFWCCVVYPMHIMNQKALILKQLNFLLNFLMIYCQLENVHFLASEWVLVHSWIALSSSNGWKSVTIVVVVNSIKAWDPSVIPIVKEAHVPILPVLQ